MKNIFKLIFMSLTLMIVLSMSAMAASAEVSVYVDNIRTELTDSDGNTVYPFIQNGTTYIPVRGISQALGCVVEWDGNNKNVLIYKDIEPDVKVFRNNSDDVKLYVDNEEQKLYDANGTEVKPFIKDGTTYVPLRGVSQVLGCWVRWDGSTKTVSVYMHTCPPDGVSLTENKPYEGGVSTYYELDGQQLEIDGMNYTNALEFNAGEYEAYFNLDGKFDTIAMTIGSTYYFEDEKRIEFIVDGKIVDTHIIPANSGAEDISVDLNRGLQLKIVRSSGSGVGMGNITFFGE